MSKVKKSKIVEVAYELLGEIRESTKEENGTLQKYYDSISDPTGLTIWDILEESKDENKKTI